MPAAQPHWRQRSRPCPFYSQGTCLFSDQCNFLHNVTCKPPPSTQSVALPSSLASTSKRESSCPVTPSSPSHLVRTRSGRSLSVSTIASETGFSEAALVQSPPPGSSKERAVRHSARLSSLIGVLRDILGPEDDGSEAHGESPQLYESDGSSAAGDIDWGSLYRQQLHSEGNSRDSSVCRAAAGFLPDIDSATCPSVVQPGLLSPLDTVSTVFANLPNLMDNCDRLLRETSVDSGYAESWNAGVWDSPPPLARSPRRHSGLTIGIPTPGVLSPGLLYSPGLNVNRNPVPLFSPTLSVYATTTPASASPFFQVSRYDSSNMEGLVTAEISPHMSDLDSPASNEVYIETYPTLDENSPNESNYPLSLLDGSFIAERSTQAVFEDEREIELSLEDYDTDEEEEDGASFDGVSPTIRMQPLPEIGRPRESTDSRGALLVEMTAGTTALLRNADNSEEGSDASMSSDSYSFASPTPDIASLARPLQLTEVPKHLAFPVVNERGRRGSSSRNVDIQSTEELLSSVAARPRADTIRASSLPRGLTAVRSPLKATLNGASRKVPFGFRNSIGLDGGDLKHVNITDSIRLDSRVSHNLERHSTMPPPQRQMSYPSGQQSSHNFESASVPVSPLQRTPTWLKPLALLGGLTEQPRVPQSAPGYSTHFTVPVLDSAPYLLDSPEIIHSSPVMHSSLVEIPHIPLHDRNLMTSHNTLPAGSDRVQPSGSLRSPPDVPEVRCRRIRTWGLDMDDVERCHTSMSEPYHPRLLHMEAARNDADLPIDMESPRTALTSRPVSSLRFSLATPRPRLFFAIASDDVSEVQRILANGDAKPNERVGDQSALAFVLTNSQLKNKLGIVKTLLAFGADPSTRDDPAVDEALKPQVEDNSLSSLWAGLDSATRYFYARATAEETERVSALLRNSFYQPITRIRYDIIGQDRAIEQLFRTLCLLSHQSSVAALVVLCCGPSGHGKSLMAQKFGGLLDVPTHTVAMTQLSSTADLWQSCSTDPQHQNKFDPRTLQEYLMENEGKRCVVVLDELEKVQDERILWSLLVPWELGRYTPESGRRPIDVKNVIWLCTSNIGQELIFDYQQMRSNSDISMTRLEYLELTRLLRLKASIRLGASLLSRVTTLLPFVPFTSGEKQAICAESALDTGGEFVRALSPEGLDTLITTALSAYQPLEGARSLHRAIMSAIIDEF